MRPEFWDALWHRDQIGFHRPAVAEQLKRHWPQLAVPAGARVFVPLCGKSLDLLWLHERGHRVLGVELSAIAVQALCMESGIPARRRRRGGFDAYEAPGLEVLCGDFFALTPADLDGITAVYDRAALVSWDEALRKDYVRHLTTLTPPGTQTLLVTLEYPQHQRPGPPFSVETAEVRHLYGPAHRIEELSRDDILDAEPRMRARGVTELHEVCYRLTRT